MQDLSDIQWREFRAALPALFLVLGAFAAASRLLRALLPRAGRRAKAAAEDAKEAGTGSPGKTCGGGGGYGGGRAEGGCGAVAAAAAAAAAAGGGGGGRGIRVAFYLAFSALFLGKWVQTSHPSVLIALLIPSLPVIRGGPACPPFHLPCRCPGCWCALPTHSCSSASPRTPQGVAPKAKLRAALQSWLVSAPPHPHANSGFKGLLFCVLELFKASSLGFVFQGFFRAPSEIYPFTPHAAGYLHGACALFPVGLACLNFLLAHAVAGRRLGWVRPTPAALYPCQPMHC